MSVRDSWSDQVVSEHLGLQVEVILGNCVLVRFVIAIYNFSMGFRSGLCGAQIHVGILFFLVLYSVCAYLKTEALSAWRYPWLTGYRSSTNGWNGYFSTLVCFMLFIIPSTNTNRPTVSQEMHFQTIVFIVVIKPKWRVGRQSTDHAYLHSSTWPTRLITMLILSLNITCFQWLFKVQCRFALQYLGCFFVF